MSNSISDSFEQIMLYSHFRNWAPDWQVVQEVYTAFPNSFSVLTPFAFAYLEEVIRSNSSEYGVEIYDKNGRPKKRNVGMELIKFAIKENKDRKPEFVSILKEIQTYYYESKRSDEGDNRHSVAHGYMHPRFWSKDSFEKLIVDIAKISKYSGF